MQISLTRKQATLLREVLHKHPEVLTVMIRDVETFEALRATSELQREILCRIAEKLRVAFHKADEAAQVSA